jgi:hypothetical protein
METDKPSFMDKYPVHIQDVIMSDIADHLLAQWLDSQLDEGTFYADYQIALMTDDDSVQKDFNEYYELTKDDDEFIEHLGA